MKAGLSRSQDSAEGCVEATSVVLLSKAEGSFLSLMRKMKGQGVYGRYSCLLPVEEGFKGKEDV